MNIDPIDHQERHSPTEQVLIHETDGARTTRQYVRRRTNARFWNQLDAQRQARAAELYTGFVVLTRGLGMVVSQMGAEGRSSRLTNDERRSAADDYLDWVQDCQRAGLTNLHLRAVALVLFRGMSPTEAANECRKRRDWVKRAVWNALDA